MANKALCSSNENLPPDPYPHFNDAEVCKEKTYSSIVWKFKYLSYFSPFLKIILYKLSLSEFKREIRLELPYKMEQGLGQIMRKHIHSTHYVLLNFYCATIFYEVVFIMMFCLKM